MKEVMKETRKSAKSNLIIDITPNGIVDKFEIVSKFPVGYILWSIGRHNFRHEGYIPLARPADLPHHIRRDSLKALKVESEELALYLMKKVHKLKVGVNADNFQKLVGEFKKCQSV